jgi:WD40 repeat protein
VSADGRWLVSAQADKISVLQIPGWQVRRNIQIDSSDVAISADGRLLAAASERAHVWDLTGNGHKVLAATEGDTLQVSFSPDGKTLASADLAGAITLWNVRTGTAAKTYKVPHDSPVWSLAFSANGRLLAAGTSEHTILIWDLVADRLTHEMKGHLDIPASLAFSPSGRHLASGASDGETRIWDVERGVPVATLIVERNSNDWLIAAPDGRFDGSEAARKNLIAWRNGSSILPAEAWHDRFYTPSLLRMIFGNAGQN